MDFFKRLSDLASFLDNELHQIEASFHVIVNSGRKYDGPADISLEIQGQIQELSGKIDELIKIGDDQSDHFDGFLKGMIDTVAEFDEKIQRIENYAANYGYVIRDKVKTDLRKSLHQIEVLISFINVYFFRSCVHSCNFMIPAPLFYEVNAPLLQVCYKP